MARKASSIDLASILVVNECKKVEAEKGEKKVNKAVCMHTITNK